MWPAREKSQKMHKVTRFVTILLDHWRQLHLSAPSYESFSAPPCSVAGDPTFAEFCMSLWGPGCGDLAMLSSAKGPGNIQAEEGENQIISVRFLKLLERDGRQKEASDPEESGPL